MGINPIKPLNKINLKVSGCSKNSEMGLFKDSVFILGKLKEGYTDNMFDNKSHKWKAIINSQLELITQKLNLSVPLRTKSARDSYATTLNRAGVSKDKIGEMLGHANSIVTEHYIASLDRETVFQVNKHLL